MKSTDIRPVRMAVTAVTLALAATGCGGGGGRGAGDDAPATTAQTTAESSATIAPEPAALRNAVDLFLAQTNGPGGVVAVSVAGSDPVVVASGLADLRTGAPMPEDAVFPLGLITDTFVNAVALQLVDEGSLSLRDRVADHLPDAPHADELTVENLLEHTSGFPQWWGWNVEPGRTLLQQMTADPSHRYTTDEVLAIAGQQPMAFAPGGGALVTPPNTLLTRLIVERVTGNDFGRELRSRILEPLGLDGTTYGVDSRRPDELLPGLVTAGRLGVSEDRYDRGEAWTTELDQTSWNTLMDSPGWMASTVTDLVRWGNSLYRTDEVVPARVADPAREVNEFGSAPIGIALTDDGVCVMLADCHATAYDYVGFGQPSLAPGAYAGLFYDDVIDTVTVVLTNNSESIRPLYEAARSTLASA